MSLRGKGRHALRGVAPAQASEQPAHGSLNDQIASAERGAIREPINSPRHRGRLSG